MIESIDRAVKEAVIAGHMIEKIRRITVVGEIASPLARDIDFFSRLFIFFDYCDFVPVFSRRGCSHKAGRPRADDDYISRHTFGIYLPFNAGDSCR